MPRTRTPPPYKYFLVRMNQPKALAKAMAIAAKSFPHYLITATGFYPIKGIPHAVYILSYTGDSVEQVAAPEAHKGNGAAPDVLEPDEVIEAVMTQHPPPTSP